MHLRYTYIINIECMHRCTYVTMCGCVCMYIWQNYLMVPLRVLQSCFHRVDKAQTRKADYLVIRLWPAHFLGGSWVKRAISFSNNWQDFTIQIVLMYTIFYKCMYVAAYVTSSAHSYVKFREVESQNYSIND